MHALRRSWELATSSWELARRHRVLFAPPALAAPVLLALAVGTFLAAARLWAAAGQRGAAGSWTAVPLVLLGVAVVAAGYLLGACVAVFAHAALVHGAAAALEGVRPTLRSMAAGAAAHTPALLRWALLSSTVGVALRGARGRTGSAGFAGRLLGLGWVLATLLVLPNLVLGHLGVRDALNRSAGAARSAWGEHLSGQVGLGFATAAAASAGALAALPWFVLGAWTSHAAIVVSAVAALAVWCVLVALASATFGAIWRTGLYRLLVATSV